MKYATILLLLIAFSFCGAAQEISIQFKNRHNPSSDTLFTNDANTMYIANQPLGSRTKISVGKLIPLPHRLLQIKLHSSDAGKKATIIITKDTSIIFSKTFVVAHKEIIKMHIGKKGKSCEVDSQISYKMKVDDFLKDPAIYISNSNYKVSFIEFTYLPRKGEIMGPYPIRGNSLQQSILGRHLKQILIKDTRVFIENIEIYCNCPMERRIKTRGAIIIQLE